MSSPTDRPEESAAPQPVPEAARAVVTATYDVAGMTCGHCERSVQEEVAELDGVVEVHADHSTGRVTVTSAEPLDPTAVAAAVEEAGYSLA
jgi:copper chaperone